MISQVLSHLLSGIPQDTRPISAGISASMGWCGVDHHSAPYILSNLTDTSARYCLDAAKKGLAANKLQTKIFSRPV
jgi:hypothetical protein